MDDHRLVEFTRELVRERSLSGEEAGVVTKICAEMRALGFDRVWVDENGSAVGVVEGRLPGPTLLLDAHCDEVDAVAADWMHPPFAAVLEDGYIYGRGVTDMKGALAAMIYAAGHAERERMRGRVAVSATTLEEVMEGRTLATVMETVTPDFVVIGEATEFNLNHGGRGRAEIVLETYGKSAHSSSPQAGKCAVHAMMKVIEAFDRAPMPSHPLVGRGLMALTDIISEPYPSHSVIPYRCRVTYDRRLLPDETPETVLAELRALPGLEDVDLKAFILAGEEKTGKGTVLRNLKFFPAWAFPSDHPFVQAALVGLRAAGFAPNLGAYQFCTNAAYSAGEARVPTVGFGPGREVDVHIVDERMAVDDLLRAARGYAGIIAGVLYS